MSLRIVPVPAATVRAFVAEWHRHNDPMVGLIFPLGVALEDTLIGVASVGRPVARAFDDGLTVEVTRCATDGTPNACSMLYGAAWRAAKARGFVRALTYTRDDESGASLRAAGWVNAAKRVARAGWDMPSRPRDNGSYDSISRWLWVIGQWDWVEGGPRQPVVGLSLPSLVATSGVCGEEQLDLLAGVA